MSQLAENIFPDTDYSSRKELIRRLNKINRELIYIDAFSPGNIVGVTKNVQSAEEGPYLLSGTFAKQTEVHPLAAEDVEVISGLSRGMAPPPRDLLKNVWRRLAIDVSYGVLGSALSPLLVEEIRSKPAVAEVVPEAKLRLRGYEELLGKLNSFVEAEAKRLNVVINRIIIRPGWSHEYEDKTSVVIYVEIQGGDEERFSLWDSICENIDNQSNSLPAPTRQFLNDNIFVVVNRDRYRDVQSE